MSRTPFDSFSKQLLEELLSPVGAVSINREVSGESQFVDVYFVPVTQPDQDLEYLGWLRPMVATPCLIEPFRNPVTTTEVRSCLLKLFALHAEYGRRTKRDPDKAHELSPHLWILTPSMSVDALIGFGATSDVEGLYRLPASLQTTIVVIHQLPVIAETVWLRLLGRGRVQRQAIAEVLKLPQSDVRRTQALRLLASWKITLEVSGIIESDDLELAMVLSQAYLEWEQKTIEQGIEAGERSLILKQLTRKLGDIPAETRSQVNSLSVTQLEDLGEALFDFSGADDLANWLRSHLI
jgi:hypothetical protein